VQEEQDATAAFDRARIMRFTVVNKEYAVSLIFTHNRLGIFSDLLQHKSSYILSESAPLIRFYNSAPFGREKESSGRLWQNPLTDFGAFWVNVRSYGLAT
jgi:hypothetical protein